MAHVNEVQQQVVESHWSINCHKRRTTNVEKRAERVMDRIHRVYRMYSWWYSIESDDDADRFDWRLASVTSTCLSLSSARLSLSNDGETWRERESFRCRESSLDRWSSSECDRVARNSELNRREDEADGRLSPNSARSHLIDEHREYHSTIPNRASASERSNVPDTVSSMVESSPTVLLSTGNYWSANEDWETVVNSTIQRKRANECKPFVQRSDSTLDDCCRCSRTDRNWHGSSEEWHWTDDWDRAKHETIHWERCKRISRGRVHRERSPTVNGYSSATRRSTKNNTSEWSTDVSVERYLPAWFAEDAVGHQGDWNPTIDEVYGWVNVSIGMTNRCDLESRRILFSLDE